MLPIGSTKLSGKTYTHPTFTALGYHAARQIRQSDIDIHYGTGDAESVYDRATLAAGCRAEYRDNFVFRSAIDRMVFNIIPGPFSIQAKTGDPGLDEIIENGIWKEYAKKPEVRGLWNFDELARLILSELLIVGDVCAVKRSSGLLQVMESERIKRISTSRDTRTTDGVEVDSDGKPIAFHFTGTPGRPGARVSADSVIYVHGLHRRISQTRPVPPLQSILSNIHRLNMVLDNEAMAWSILTSFAMSITKADAGLQGGGATDTYADSKSIQDRFVDVQQGIVYNALPGEDIKGIDRNIPGSNFGNSVLAYMKLIAMSLGMPIEVLMLDWSTTNFSSHRGAREQFFTTLRAWQSAIVGQFISPVYEYSVQQFVAAGMLPDIPAITNHEVIPAPFTGTAFKEEAERRAIEIDRGYRTHGSVIREIGGDPESRRDEIENEVRDAIERAKRIQKETGVEVDYRIFCGRLAKDKMPNVATPKPREINEEPIPK